MPATFVRLLGALLQRVVLVVVAMVTVAGCAHHDAQATASRVLVGAGAVAMVVGALAAAGCDDISEGEGCSGSSDDADVDVGLPVMAAGAAMIAGGIAARPKDQGPAPRRAAPTAAPTPAPVARPETSAGPDSATPAQKTYSPGPRIELLQSAP